MCVCPVHLCVFVYICLMKAALIWVNVPVIMQGCNGSTSERVRGRVRGREMANALLLMRENVVCYVKIALFKFNLFDMSVMTGSQGQWHQQRLTALMTITKGNESKRLHPSLPQPFTPPQMKKRVL